MIEVGKVTVTEQRREALASGVIMCVLKADKGRRLWLGSGHGCDFLAVETVSPEGDRWFMGRVRFHVDDKLLGSADRKQIMQVCVGAEVPGVVSDSAIARLLFAVKSSGVEVVEVDCGMCSSEALTKRMTDAVAAVDGSVVSVRFGES